MYNNFYIRFNYKNIIPFNLKKNKLRVHSNIIANKKKKKQSVFFRRKVRLWYYYFNINGLKRDNITTRKFLNKKLSVFFISNLNMIEGKWALPKTYRKHYRKKFRFLKKKKFNFLKSTYILNNNYSNYNSNLYHYNFLNLNYNQIYNFYYFYNFNNYLKINKNYNLVFFKYLKNYRLKNLYKFYLQKYQKFKNIFDKTTKKHLKKKINANYDYKGNLNIYKKKNLKHCFKLLFLKNYKNNKDKFNNKKMTTNYCNITFDHKNRKAVKNCGKVKAKGIWKRKGLKLLLMKKISSIIKFIRIFKAFKKYNKKNLVSLFYKLYIYFKFIKLYKNKNKKKIKVSKNLFNNKILYRQNEYNKIFKWLKLLTLKKTKKLGLLEKYNKKKIFKWIKLLYNNLQKISVKKKFMYNIIKIKNKFMKLLNNKIYVKKKILIYKDFNLFNNLCTKYILLGQIWWNSKLFRKKFRKLTYNTYQRCSKSKKRLGYKKLKSMARITDIIYKYQNNRILYNNIALVEKARILLLLYRNFSKEKKKKKKNKSNFSFKDKYLKFARFRNKYIPLTFFFGWKKNIFPSWWKLRSRDSFFRKKKKQFCFLPKNWLVLILGNKNGGKIK